MRRRFKYLIDQYTISGARNIFEEICENLFRTIHGNAFQVKPNPGDGGIDIFINSFQIDMIVVQCKFFPDGIGDAQKKQIRESFKICLSNNEGVKEWCLCIPSILNENEHKWWSKWSKEQKVNYNISISLYDESYLLDKLIENNLYDQYFDTIRVDKKLLERLTEKDKINKINDDFKLIISYISQNDFCYNAIDAILEIDRLCETYRADIFFYNSPFINRLELLAQIVSMNAYNGIVSNPNAKDEINKLRHELISEYKLLVLEK